MILACPSCEVKFKIPNGVVTGAGRKVRCASCKNVWHAVPEDAFQPQAFQKPLEAAMDDKPAQSQQLAAAGPTTKSGQEAETVGEAEEGSATDTPTKKSTEVEKPIAEAVEAQESDTSSDLPEEVTDLVDQTQDFVSNISKALDNTDINIADLRPGHLSEEDIEEQEFLARRRAEERKETERKRGNRRRAVILGGWAALIMFVGSLMTTLFLFKDTAVSIFPPVQALYSGVESVDYRARFRENNGEPLSAPITEAETIVNVYITGQPTVERIGGADVLLVEGYIENSGRRAATVPRLKFRVVDSRGNTLETWEDDPKGSILTRGQKLAYETQLSPVPPKVSRAIVSIIEGSRSSGRAEAP